MIESGCGCFLYAQEDVGEWLKVSKGKCQCPLRSESSWLEQFLDKAKGDKKVFCGVLSPAILNLELRLMITQFHQTRPELIQINCEALVHYKSVLFCQNVF